MSPAFHAMTPASVHCFPPGATVPNPQPGDFMLTHGVEWTDRLIRFGQRLRFRGADAPYAHWNHCAIFADAEGGIIEALAQGVAQRNIALYHGTEYTVVSIQASLEDRQQAVTFAEKCVGEAYGWLTIVSIAWTLLTGGRFSFAIDGQQICSGLVARAEERTWAIFDRDPAHIMPADLARYYQVAAPPPGTPVGTPPPPAGRLPRFVRPT